MAKVILGVTISLDGYAEDRNGSVGTLYPDLDTLRNTKVMQEAIQSTGAVVMAWKEFALAEDSVLSISICRQTCLPAGREKLR